MVTVNQIPGYDAAVAAESEARQEAWLGIEPPICGVSVNPLTLRNILYLSLAKNPFLVEIDQQGYTLGEIGEFLWVVSTDFVHGDIPARDRFIKGLMGLSVDLVISGILDYLERSFYDVAAHESGGSASAPRVDWISATINRFASEYGWHPEYTLDLSYRQLNQLRRCQKAADPESAKALINPASDVVLDKWLESQNRKDPKT